jgi:DNA-binding transcriptional LysR family regulator
MIDPRRLLTFREVAHRRSFSRAAEALALTQPAVSQQVRALEVQLGERLIERGRPGFALTATGGLLLAHADALAERLQLADMQLGEAIAGAHRLLRIGAFPSVLATVVPKAIVRVSRSGDPLEFSAVQGATDELVAAVRDGSLHVAICFEDAAQPPREHEGTSRVELLQESMLGLVGAGHRLAGRRRIRLPELTGDTWTAATRNGLIVRSCIAAGFEPHVPYLTDDPLAIRGIVSAGLAVSLTPQLLAGQLRGVATPALTGDPVRRRIYAVMPPTAAHPLAEPFLDAVRAASGT